MICVNTQSYKVMTQENKELILDIKQLLENCRELDKAIQEQERCVKFLINEYKTNKHYFRDKPGRVTVEDVIKTCFEFGWASKRNFDYDTGR